MITAAKLPKYANPENTLIDLVATHSKFGDIPFSASANDTEATGRDLHARALAGEFGAIAPYVAPVIPQAVLDAQDNAAADKAIAAMIPEAVSLLVTWAEKTATGADKTALKTMLDKINAEKAKKK